MAKDPYRYFRPEAREALEAITQGVLEIERGSAAAEVADRILRVAHTLKGAAGVVRLPEVVRRAHAIEEVLAPHRGGGPPVPRGAIEQLLRLVDEIGTDLAALDPAAASKTRAGEEPAAGPAFETIRVEVADLDLVVDGITEVSVQTDALRQVAEQLGTVRDRLIEILKAAEAETGSAPVREASGREQEPRRRSKRDLSGIVSEIQHRLGTYIHRVQRDLSEVRRRADRLRLLPAKSLFAELERAARDAAQLQGKTVRFETEGGEERLDAHVLSQLRKALLHLVRNAVGHGIEDPGSRVDAGKPRDGRVRLQVERRGHRLSFQCADDGRGVDLEAVRRAARDRGLLSEEEAKKLDREEALRLIFRAGLSTTQEATVVSGRGVGLDVVADVTARLKGQVAARSQPGQGTQVEIVVPVSLTSLETLAIEQAAVRASLPFTSVRRVLRVSRSEIVRSGEGESILCSGGAVPFRDLTALLGAKGPRGGEGRTASAVIVQASSGLAALGVDRLLGRRHEVIRPLPAVAGELPLLSGASFDPEGNPSLVLDPHGVVEAVARGAGRSSAHPTEARPPILVVDDSLTTRMLEQTILEANGYEVDLATSGEEALSMVRKRRYGVMLVDVEMPAMNGFELLERVRSDPELRGVPAILVTTRGSVEDRRRGMEVGARAYMLKSEFDEGLLLQTIRGIIG